MWLKETLPTSDEKMFLLLVLKKPKKIEVTFQADC